MFMKRKIKSAKGFTLAELLIVVAIIAVLVAIGIPIFTSQLEKSREAVDLSDVRSAYAEVMMAAITGDTTAIYTKDANQKIYNQAGNVYSITVKPLKQKQDGWQTALPITIGGVSSTDIVHWVGTPGANGVCVITYIPPAGAADEAVKFTWSGGTGEENSGTGGNGGGISGGDNGGTDVDNGSNNPSENPGTNPSNPGEDSGTNNSSKGTWSNPIEYPDKPAKGELFNFTIGNVYTWKGILYVAATTAQYNHWYYNEPDKTNHFVPPSGTLLTPKDEDSKHEFSKINVGDVYRAEDGTLYISLIGPTNGQSPVLDKNPKRWVKINS